jgi:hypothetical protein
MKNHESFSEILSLFESSNPPSASHQGSTVSLMSEKPSFSVQISQNAQRMASLAPDPQIFTIVQKFIH